MTCKVLFICGGSGGHIFPCIAIAEYFATKGIECYFLVSDKTVDIKIMDNFPFAYATITKISNKFDYLFFTYKHYKNVRTLLNYLNPSIVISTGSIYSFIPLLYLLKENKKIFLFEPNTIPGRVNGFLFNFCEKVFTGWKYDYSKYFFGDKAIVSGIPLRNNIKIKYDKNTVLNELGLQQNKKTVLIVGGSQGALFLNSYIVKILAQSEISCDIQIILLTASKSYERIFEENRNIKILPFTVDVGKFYSVADLAITRSGAITLAEICYRQIPNISIPYIGSANDHQLMNSKFLQEKGLTFCIEEKKFKESDFIKVCKKLLFYDNLISNVKMTMESFFIRDAEKTIYKEICNYL